MISVKPSDVRKSISFLPLVVLAGIFCIASAGNAATVIVTANVTSTTAWTANNVYVVQNSITVNSGATLTIASGTVVKVETSSTLLTVDGNLQANGASTPSGTVIFTAYKDDTGGDTNGDGTSTFPQTGDWDGIEFVGGSSSTLNYTVVRYAGNSTGNVDSDLYVTGGNLAVVHSTIASSSNEGIKTSGGKITLTSSTVSNNSQYGICESASTGTLSVVTSNFSNNAAGTGDIDLSKGISFTPSGDTASGSSTEGWLLTTNPLTANETIQQDLPYVLSGQLTVNAGTTLTVNPGAIIKFLGVATFLDDKGNLNAQGTSANPIYFTSINDNIGGNTSGSSTLPSRGDWGTIEIEAGATSTISNAIVRYGGSTQGTSGDALIYQIGGTLTISNTTIASSSNHGLHLATQGHVTISSSTISNNAGYGVYADRPLGFLTLATDTFATNSNADGAVDYGTGVFAFSGSGDMDNVTSTGGDRGYVMYGTTATGTGPVWSQDLPYIVNSLTVASGSSLTVNPGVVVKFVQYDGLTVNGVLDVAGTSANPVYFTALDDNSVSGNTNGNSTSTPAKGDGAYIDINSTNAASTISNAIVRYGGSGAQTFPANI